MQTFEFVPPELDETRTEEIADQPPLSITPPDEYFYPKGILIGIRFKVVGRYGRPIRGNVKIDPNTFTTPVLYTNVLTGEVMSFPLHALPIGEKRVSPGKFYCTYHPLSYFYCDSIKGDLITWKQIESFQRGQLIRSATTQNVKYSHYYLPVTDKKLLNRLQGRLQDYDRLDRK